MSSIYIFIQYCPKQLGTTYSYGPTYLLRQEWNGERLGTYPYPTVMDSTSNEPLLAVVLFFFCGSVQTAMSSIISRLLRAYYICSSVDERIILTKQYSICGSKHIKCLRYYLHRLGLFHLFDN